MIFSSYLKYTATLSALAAVSTVATPAFAKVPVFQRDEPISIFNEDLKVPLVGASKKHLPKKFDSAKASRMIVDYLNQHRDAFDMGALDKDSLPLRTVRADDQGYSLRFEQVKKGIPIAGAELIALFDLQGKLTALNSSLVATPKVRVSPAVSRASALRAAAAELHFSSYDEGHGRGDGLEIVTASAPSTGKPTAITAAQSSELVWQFSLRDAKSGTQAATVQVIAEGPRAGKIYGVVPAGAGLDRIDIYDGSLSFMPPNPNFKGVKVMQNGNPVIAFSQRLDGAEAHHAFASLNQVRDYYRRIFGRDSYDGHGADLDASINLQKFKVGDAFGAQESAAWMAPWKMFVFGAGDRDFHDVSGALDIVGHEYTHAVIGETAMLEGSGQPGALAEHLADLFGALIRNSYDKPENPFLIGDTILSPEARKKAPALRDMLHPEKSLTPQPADMADIPEEYGANCVPTPLNDRCGVHSLSGIPNRAIALLIKEMGWDMVQRIFYRVMTMRLRSNSDFNDYRDQLVNECQLTLEDGDCEIIRDSFQAVGL